MANNQHILFIHIPKTAGTSFRVAAEEYFGKENTFYDYGLQSKETSKEIMDYLYSAKDPYKFYEHISKLDQSFLSGHFPTVKYASLYDTLNVVSFVRDPIEQVISHYNHHKNRHNYNKSLKEFAKEARFRNLQSKILKGKLLTFYGFLGLTDEYSLSIDMFNVLYDKNFSYKHMNIKNKNSLNMKDIDETTIDLIKRWNKMDIELHNNVQEQFKVRKELYNRNLPFTHGLIQKVNATQISGLAFQYKNENALEIDIFLEDKYLETVIAKNLRPGQIQKNVPRKGYIGFDYISKDDDVLDGKLRAFVKLTGQEII